MRQFAPKADEEYQLPLLGMTGNFSFQQSLRLTFNDPRDTQQTEHFSQRAAALARTLNFRPT